MPKLHPGGQKEKREKKTTTTADQKNNNNNKRFFGNRTRGSRFNDQCVNNYSTVVVDFVFSTQPPWAFLPCPPKIYLRYAGGQRERPPIAVEVHYPRTTTSARLYFTCALLSDISFIDVHV